MLRLYEWNRCPPRETGCPPPRHHVAQPADCLHYSVSHTHGAVTAHRDEDVDVTQRKVVIIKRLREEGLFDSSAGSLGEFGLNLLFLGRASTRPRATLTRRR